MPVLETPLVLAWVLVWFAIVGFGAPMLALGRAAGRRTVMLTLGPALVCSWLTLAVGVPLAAAVHGFNWVTAFVIAAVCPVGLWLCTYRRASGIAFRRLLRGVIVGAVTMNVRRVPRVDARKWIVPVGGVVLLLFSALMIGAR